MNSENSYELFLLRQFKVPNLYDEGIHNNWDRMDLGLFLFSCDVLHLL